MTKKDFLKALKQSAKNAHIKNDKVLIERYNKRFNLAYEAGISEEETCEKFGDVEDIINNFKTESDVEFDKVEVDVEKEKRAYTDYKDFSIDIQLVADEVDIRLADVENPSIEFNDANPDDYTIEATNHLFKLNFTPKAHFLTRMKRNHLIVTIPDIHYKNFKVSVVSGKYKIPALRAKNISLKAVSGNYNVVSMLCDKLDINLVSGKTKIESLECTNFVIHNVSGNVSIANAICDNLIDHSVTGNVMIESGNVRNSVLDGLAARLKINGINQSK